MVWTKIIKLTAFENVNFQNENFQIQKRNNFQDQLKQELKRMKDSNKTITFANKTTNI